MNLRRQFVTLECVFDLDDSSDPQTWDWDGLCDSHRILVVSAGPVLDDEVTRELQAKFDDEYDPTPMHQWEVTEGRDVSETPNYVEAHNI